MADYPAENPTRLDELEPAVANPKAPAMISEDNTSRIMTLDMAHESTDLAREKILRESGVALAAQANLDTQSAWLLLR
ncbi:MAG: hypothetical protein HZA93_10505 [Verrucomicrobia bacterium]|nr:hypothetical protein [Verrucomicrobiota bacterium]